MSAPLLDVVLPLVPITKSRPRVVRIGGKSRTFTPKKTATFEAAAAAYLNVAMVRVRLKRIEKPRLLRVEAVFVLPRPKNWPKTKRLEREPHGCRPDLDNLVKSLKDAMDGVVMADDAQIVRLETEKWYAARGESASISVKVWEVAA